MAMCASGNFSRSRSSAGVVITASPSQFVPRIKIRRADGSWLAIGFISAFPSAVHPEPVRRIATHGDFKGAVHIAHDSFGRTRRAIFLRWNFFAKFKAPFRQSDAVANDGVKQAIVSQRENGWREIGI